MIKVYFFQKPLFRNLSYRNVQSHQDALNTSIEFIQALKSLFEKSQ